MFGTLLKGAVVGGAIVFLTGPAAAAAFGKTQAQKDRLQDIGGRLRGTEFLASAVVIGAVATLIVAAATNGGS